MKTTTIRSAVVLPKGKRPPSRHVTYRKYAGAALAEAERLAHDHGAVLTSEPPVFVGTEPMGHDPSRMLAVFELTALLPDD